jgi:N-acetylglucosaminyldiphosphoundecaprenol N-acetyl-beta-D-mannosaminyltransferase
MADRVYFLNTRFDRMTPDEAVELLLARLLMRQGGKVNYANAHTMVTASKTPALVEALRNTDLLLADGSGVRWGSALLGSPLVYNLNGTDLVPAICKAGAERGLSVYLLGAKPGVAEDAAANLQKVYPGLVIAGTRDGYFSKEETPRVLEEIRAARPHLLLVAMGNPLQEIWIEQHADQLPGITCMGVGGLFDFLALRVSRAPRFLRAIGMEWTWRLAQEPGRMWRRYVVGNTVFFGLVATYALSPRPLNELENTVVYEAADASLEYSEVQSA